MSSLIDQEFKIKIQNILNGSNKVLFLGIGEINMTDDGFGPYIITYFIENNKITTKNTFFINAFTVPEERQDEIEDIHPDVLIILDTCDIDERPGKIIFVNEEKIPNFITISSHTLPLPMFIKVLKEKLPKLSVFLLGIIPFSLKAQNERKLYKPDKYTLDDYDNNLNLPFYAFNMTPELTKISDNLIKFIEECIDINSEN